jgi:cytochrome c biogenesis protein CcmG/thiol:disulfide interchange protein DsbE
VTNLYYPRKSVQYDYFLKIGLLILALIGINFYVSTSVYAATTEATAAPAFSLQNEAGATVSLSDFAGKPVVLHFWATWCPYCKKLQPGLVRLKLANKDSDLVILGISFNEDEGAAPAQTLIDRGIDLDTVVNGDKTAQDYGVQGTPTTVFINRQGEIVWQTNISDPNHPDLDKAVAFIIKDNE